jgi:hypothetical protein
MKSIEPGAGSQAQEKMLKGGQRVFGFVPNLLQKMANPPIVVTELDNVLVAKQWSARQ